MIYIKSAKQISAQAPLSEAWIEEPLLLPQGGYVRSQDPAFRQWLSPLESRRLGPLLKRALVTATEAMGAAGVSQPAAIVTGTGLGCIENTELLLNQLCREGDTALKPTHFMQSTHNTIGSLIAISTHCHGYNSTYSHKGVSFDSALLDAFLQLRLGDAATALVTGNDELTPSYFTILKRGGYLGQPGEVAAGEAAVAMVLTTEADGALCQLSDMQLATTPGGLSVSADVDAILIGTNGSEAHDRVYRDLLRRLSPADGTPLPPLLHYKHLFGEGYCASALGVYAAAHVIARGAAPAHLRCDGMDRPLPVGRLLLLNHSSGTSFSAITLTKAPGHGHGLDDMFIVEGEVAMHTLLRLNGAHPVYAAHFPGQPITPGVCQVKMLGMLAGRIAGRQLELQKIVNLKFVLPLRPDACSQLAVDFTSFVTTSPATIAAKGTVSADGQVATKFSLQWHTL